MRREETLLFARKKKEIRKYREKARKFPPFNCKGNKESCFKFKTSRTKKERERERELCFLKDIVKQNWR